MSKEQITEQVQKLRKALEELEKRLADARVPFNVLEEFKMAVDHIRMTVWAMLSTEASKHYEMRSSIAVFRLKRMLEMSKQLILDIEANDVTIDSPELQQCHGALKRVVERIDRLYKSGV